MCPYDMKKNLIVDDELRGRFANDARRACDLTVISDSCFSGSVTRGDRCRHPTTAARGS